MEEGGRAETAEIRTRRTGPQDTAGAGSADAGKHGREPARQREETDGTADGKPARGLRAQPSGYRKTGADGTEGHEAVVPHCPVMTTGDCLCMKRGGRPYFFQ